MAAHHFGAANARSVFSGVLIQYLLQQDGAAGYGRRVPRMQAGRKGSEAAHVDAEASGPQGFYAGGVPVAASLAAARCTLDEVQLQNHVQYPTPPQ
eukprot:2114674-Amphidinium_carterae.1